MESECTGCNNYISLGKKGPFCSKGFTQNVEGCPCRTCLVKVVCLHACDEFKKYVLIANDIIKKRELCG